MLAYDVVHDGEVEVRAVRRAQGQTPRPGRLARVHGHQADQTGNTHFGCLGWYVHGCHPQRYWQGNSGPSHPEGTGVFP
jgi:hypothetical protein